MELKTNATFLWMHDSWLQQSGKVSPYPTPIFIPLLLIGRQNSLLGSVSSGLHYRGLRRLRNFLFPSFGAFHPTLLRDLQIVLHGRAVQRRWSEQAVFDGEQLGVDADGLHLNGDMHTSRLSPCTKTCATASHLMYMFSIFSGAMYSPCASLKMCFFLSTIRSANSSSQRFRELLACPKIYTYTGSPSLFRTASSSSSFILMLHRGPCCISEPALPSSPCHTYLIVHPVQQSGNHGEHGGSQCAQVIGQQANVSLKEANPGSVHYHHPLLAASQEIREGKK
ncbi:hypothetical protein EYF80_023760 [Liparis tanakae]|uniref:Uncharacterized protein n=1 Tax=Liparis tanakae TaxID=230148 RepID=A0A4Z2HM35_9TELE|nr:hypothetical protein EYF80_023760 [Liparis tanakae]